MDMNGYHLRGLGLLVDFNIHEDQKNGQLPHVVVVMDMSGSMGDLCSIVLSKSLPEAMSQVGYSPDATVDIITFASQADILKLNGSVPTLQSLRNQYLLGAGSTNMEGVFPLLKTFLSRYKNIVLFGVSDGEIFDQVDTLRSAKQYSDNFGSHVDVVMVRLKTSSASNPDTRALACLGQFSTSGKNNIYDVDTEGLSKAMLTQEISTLFTKHLNNGNQSCLNVQGKNLRRSPIDVPVASMSIVANQRVCFLLALDANEIKVNETTYKIKIQEELSLDVLSNFCEYVSSQLHVQHIIGNDVTLLKNWFSKLEASLPNEDHHHQNLLSRVKQLQMQCNKTIKSEVRMVLHLANQDKLSNLNSQQAADYLRNSASMALAKRNARNKEQQEQRGETESLQQQAFNLLKALRETGFNDQKEESESSFYSAYNNQETFEVLLRENLNPFVLQDLDILRLFGILGITYNAKVCDLVDPYLFRVKTILGGGYLSTHDLREANSVKINGVQAELSAPGTETIITGVIPLRMLNPSIFDIVWTHGMKLLEAHASINMRRMLAPVRSDMLGERIGLLCCIMRNNHNYKKRIPEREMQIFDDICYQLNQLMLLDINKQEFGPTLEKLRREQSIRNDLTGSNNMSCMQKPLIALLELRLKMKNAYVQDLLHMLYEFDAYHAARRYFSDRAQRDQVLKELFSVNVQKLEEDHPLSQLPYFEEECEGKYRVEMVGSYVSTLASQIETKMVPQTICRWMPCVSDYVGYYRFLSSDEKLPMQICPRKQILAMVAAIHCECEQDRVVNQESKTFEWNNKESEKAFFDKVIRQFYVDDYVKKALLELQRRDNQQLMTQIYLMSQPDIDVASFVDILQEHIPNRQHPGYALLLHEILKTNEIDSAKLYLLVTGRNEEQDVVFAQGNFDDQFWSFQKHFSADTWKKMVELRQEFGVYVYRSCDKPNSHGHCNSNPSYWAIHEYKLLRPPSRA